MNKEKIIGIMQENISFTIEEIEETLAKINLNKESLCKLIDQIKINKNFSEFAQNHYTSYMNAKDTLTQCISLSSQIVRLINCLSALDQSYIDLSTILDPENQDN